MKKRAENRTGRRDAGESAGGRPSRLRSAGAPRADMLFNLCNRMLGDYDRLRLRAGRLHSRTAGWKLQGDAAFATWLYRIALNTCRNRLASAEYRRARKAVRLEGTGADDAIVSANGRSSFRPGGAARARRAQALIQRALNDLPPDKALRPLRHRGRSYEEAAALTGIPLGRSVEARQGAAQAASKLEGIV